MVIREKALVAQMKEARENPNIPDSVMEQMRREAEAEAARRAAAEAEKAAAISNAALQEAQTRAKEAEERLAAVQKNSRISNPDIMSINALGNQILNTWNTIKGHKMKAIGADPDNAAPIDNFLKTLIQRLQEDLA